MWKDHSYPPVKYGITRKEAERIVDENEGEYFLVKDGPWSTGALSHVIAYGEYAGVDVELIGGPNLSLGFMQNTFLVKGTERNISNRGLDALEVESSKDWYSIDVTSWEIVTPIHREWAYTFHSFRLFPPSKYIDQYDVDHGDYWNKTANRSIIMAANFEITLWGEEYIPLSQTYKLFHIFGKDVVPHTVTAYSDYLLSEKKREFSSITDNEILESVLRGHFVISYGKVADTKIGVSSYKNGPVFETDLWLDTQQYPELDDAFISEESASIYHRVIRFLLEENFPMNCCAIGSELSVQYEQDVMNMVSRGHGVAVWIVPQSAIHACPPNWQIICTAGQKVILRRFLLA